MDVFDAQGTPVSRVAQLLAKQDDNSPELQIYSTEMSAVEEELRLLRHDYLELLAENEKLHKKLKKARKEKKRWKHKYIKSKGSL